MFMTMHVNLIVLFAAATLLVAPAQARELKRVGWVEEIAIADVGTVVKAKLDTGAKTSSIDAEIIDIRKTGEKTKTETGETVVFSVSLEKAARRPSSARSAAMCASRRRAGATFAARSFPWASASAGAW
ncbi:MAG: hypothetical protein DI582_02565 [Azospirillum brasilense]|nr:MAG: hypothetical protein DI582_02565 [Azospirillum brasilense]